MTTAPDTSRNDSHPQETSEMITKRPLVNEIHRNIYMDGWDAQLTGKAETNNPYSFGSHLERDRARTWATGWTACHQNQPLPLWYQKWAKSVARPMAAAGRDEVGR